MGQVSKPFDEFEDAVAPGVPRGIVARWTLAALRLISFVSLWTAIGTAAFIILSHGVPGIIGRPLPFSVKSGVPLLAIGLSYISLVVTLPRSPSQYLVGILVGVAFVLWGSEQFLKNREIISFIDDCVVFLFVTDLSIVIRRNFRECAHEGPVREAGMKKRGK